MTETVHGPERLARQGLRPEQMASSTRAILALLTEPPVCDQVDLVMAWRQDPNGRGGYEVWARRGMVRFDRVIAEDGRLSFPILEVCGQNPLEDQRTDALGTIAAEKEAAQRSGFEAEDPRRRFVRAEHQSYPFAYERVAQLFDSPNAPDLAISPNDWTFGIQPGTHGGLHVRQARAPLWLAGPGIAPGQHALAARAVDIAPTVLKALGFPYVDGRDATGRTSSERGVGPDVLLARQDGRVVEEVLDEGAGVARYLHIFLLDGLHHTELEDRIANDPESLPNLRRLRERAAIFGSGSIVNYPSITWPSHTAIGTGTWCGHHDVVNPSYYLREKREMISPQGQQVHTERFSNPEVESLYEAFSRVRGEACLTAAIYAPFGRSADHAVLEGRNLCDKPALRALNDELARDEDPRWKEDGHEDAARESTLDTRGIAQLYDLFRRDDVRSPDMVFHELILTDGVGHDYGPHGDGIRAALDESDRRIGRVLDLLEEQGRLDDTLFVVTADHGMAPQDVTLAANPGRHLLKMGLQAQVADTMVWLTDFSLEVERAADGRTGRVLVREADPLPSGEHPVVADARVEVVSVRAAGTAPEPVASGRTGPSGVFGFSTPVDVDNRALRLRVEADGFNDQTVDLEGRPDVDDPRNVLYAP